MDANRNDVLMRLFILREKVRLGAIRPELTPEFDIPEGAGRSYHEALRRMQELQREKATILCAGAHCNGGAGGGAVELKAWNGIQKSRKCAVCMQAEWLEMYAAGALRK